MVGQSLLEDIHDFVHAVHDELPALIDLRQNGSIIFSRTVHFRRLVRGCIKTRLEEKRPIRPQKNASPRFFLPAKHRLRELLKRTRIVKEVQTCAFTLAWWPSRSAARRAVAGRCHRPEWYGESRCVVTAGQTWRLCVLYQPRSS